MNDGDLIGNTSALRISFGELGHIFVVLNANCLCAELPGGLNWYLSVTRTEVIDQVVSRYFCSLKHSNHQIIGCRNPDDILAMLANGGLVFVIAVLLRNGRARTQLEKSNEGQCNIVRNSHGDSFRKMTLEC